MSIQKYLAFCCVLIMAGLCIGDNVLAQHLAKGRSFYLCTAGNDDNSGTITRPFKTIDKINAQRLKAGEAIYFKGGETFLGTLKIVQGSNGRPIVYSSYGRGRAIINAGDSTAINVYNVKDIKIQRLKLIGAGRKSGNVKDGMAIVNSSNIKCKDIEISGFQKSGLLIYASQHVIIDNVFVHDNGSAGITVEGPYQKRKSSYIKILNCRAENNPGDPTNLTNHSGNGIVVGDCRNVLIDHCTATTNGWDMPRIGNGPVGIWAYEADSVTIQHCLSYKNKTSKGGADGGGFDLDGGVTNSIVQYCLSYNNQGSGYCLFQYWGASAWHNNIFRYNISENDGTVSDSQAGLYIWNSSDDEKQFHDCDVYGNIIYNEKVAAISFSEVSKSRGIRFYNNVFVGRDSLIKGKDKIGAVIYFGNNWWSIEKGFNVDGITNLNTWAIKTGKEQKDGVITGVTIKPGFHSPGKAGVTSASQLKTFKSYDLSPGSLLKSKAVYISRNGINNIKL